MIFSRACSRWKHPTLVGALVLALLASACQSGALAEPPSETRVFRVGTAPLASLDPVLASQPQERLVARQLFDGLVRYDDTTAAVVPNVATSWDIIMNYTPVDPTYPGGSLLIAGTPVAGPTNSTRFKLSVPAYTNYTYEIYGNPTLANVGNNITNLSSSFLTNMSWAALPFSLSQAGALNTNRYTAPSNGTLNLYLQEKAAKGYYYVSFRVPGANRGTP